MVSTQRSLALSGKVSKIQVVPQWMICGWIAACECFLLPFIFWKSYLQPTLFSSLRQASFPFYKVSSYFVYVSLTLSSAGSGKSLERALQTRNPGIKAI